MRADGRRRPFWYPKLEILESRLPPGDALLGVLWSMGLAEDGWPGLSPRSSGDEPGLHVVQPQPPDVDWMSHPEPEHWVARPESAKGVASPNNLPPLTPVEDAMRSNLLSPLSADPLASPFDAAARTTGFRRQIGTGMSTARVATVDAVTAPVPVLAGRPAVSARHNLSQTASVSAVPAGFTSQDATVSDTAISQAQKDQVTEQFGKLPLSFEQNVGQFDDRVDFVTRGGGATVFLTPTAAVFAMQNSESGNQNSEFRIQNSESNELSARPFETPRPPTGVALHMQIVGGNSDARGRLPTSCPASPITSSATTRRSGARTSPASGGWNTTRFTPASTSPTTATMDSWNTISSSPPGINPNLIKLRFDSADSISVDAAGDFVAQVGEQTLRQQELFVYQDVAGRREEVRSRFIVRGQQVSFGVAAYDPSRPLFIDPILSYSTYLGGSGAENAFGIAVDSAEGAYVTGNSYSIDFPTENPIQINRSGDLFVAKLSPQGNALVYSTYLGGCGGANCSGNEFGYDIAVDASGNAYVTGYTESTDFPTTSGAFDTTYNLGTDAFVAKLNAGGTALTYSTFLGGTSTDRGVGIAVDTVGNGYITGFTASTNFPTTAGAFDSTKNLRTTPTSSN